MGDDEREVWRTWLPAGSHSVGMDWPDFRQPPRAVWVERDGVRIALSVDLAASEGAQDTTTEPGTEEACRTTQGGTA